MQERKNDGSPDGRKTRTIAVLPYRRQAIRSSVKTAGYPARKPERNQERLTDCPQDCLQGMKL